MLDIVKFCIELWKINNLNWLLIVLDKDKVNEELLRKYFLKDIIEVSYFDFLCFYLLEKYGGIWVDVIMLCFNFLDYWVYILLLLLDVFLFMNFMVDRMIVSWFIVLRKNSVGVCVWNKNV